MRCIYFCRPDDPDGYLSNYYYCSPFVISSDVIGGKRTLEVQTSQQGIMWLKALLMHDEEVATKIETQTDPVFCKELGRRIKKFDQSKWDAWRLVITEYVLMQKFSSCPLLLRKLQHTGTFTLAEANPSDRIWGIGISVEQAENEQKWTGHNLLGEALMSVRSKLKD